MMHCYSHFLCTKKCVILSLKETLWHQDWCQLICTAPLTFSTGCLRNFTWWPGSQSSHKTYLEVTNGFKNKLSQPGFYKSLFWISREIWELFGVEPQSLPCCVCPQPLRRIHWDRPPPNTLTGQRRNKDGLAWLSHAFKLDPSALMLIKKLGEEIRQLRIVGKSRESPWKCAGGEETPTRTGALNQERLWDTTLHTDGGRWELAFVLCLAASLFAANAAQAGLEQKSSFANLAKGREKVASLGCCSQRFQRQGHTNSIHASGTDMDPVKASKNTRKKTITQVNAMVLEWLKEKIAKTSLH